MGKWEWLSNWWKIGNKYVNDGIEWKMEVNLPVPLKYLEKNKIETNLWLI